MTREEFETEYVKRHMGYDPRCDSSKLLSCIRDREDNGYYDDHRDLCWKLQQIQDEKIAAKRQSRLKLLRW